MHSRLRGRTLRHVKKENVVLFRRPQLATSEWDNEATQPREFDVTKLVVYVSTVPNYNTDYYAILEQSLH